MTDLPNNLPINQLCSRVSCVMHSKYLHISLFFFILKSFSFFRGFGAIIEDYVTQSLKKFAYVLMDAVSIGTFIGLIYLNYFDVGICKAVQMLWAVK